MIVTRLARLAKTISGSGFPPSQQGAVSGDYPFVKVSDLARGTNSKRVVDAANWVTREQARALGARIVPPGSTIFPKVGAALLGNARGHTASPLVMDNNMMAVLPVGLHDRFVFWWLRTVDMAELSEGGTLPFVSDSAVRDLAMPVVTLEQQRRIADFLDDRIARIDQIITVRRQQLRCLEDRFAATRRVSVLQTQSGAIRPSGLPWAPEVPTGWPVRRLTQVSRMGTGHTPSRNEPDYWNDCDIPWLTTGDVYRFRGDGIDTISETAIEISRLGLANSSAVLHPAGTVALSRTASAGFSIIMGNDMATSQDYVTWTCGPELVPEYLLQLLRVMRPYLLGFLAMGSTHKTIYFPDLMDLRIPLPDVSTQHDGVRRVADAAAARRSTSVALESQVVLLAEYKQSLITAAVTGELDVSTASSGIPG